MAVGQPCSSAASDMEHGDSGGREDPPPPPLQEGFQPLQEADPRTERVEIQGRGHKLEK